MAAEQDGQRGHVFQLNVSRGGVPKLPVPCATVTTDGLIGDEHNDKKNHGGPERALCLYSLENFLRLQAEGHPAYPGSIGENVTTAGIDFAALRPGDRLRLGDEVLIEITKYTTPCFKIKAAFQGGEFTRISHKTHPGESRVYARVLQGGELRPGAPIVVEPRDEAAAKGVAEQAHLL